MKRASTLLLLLILILHTRCAEEEFLSQNNLTGNFNTEGFEVINPLRPLLTKVETSGSKVTLHFINHAAPDQPEGGFELMMNGKRTKTNIIPRLYSSQKHLKMTLNMDNPQQQRYQIYARWNSGYLSSNELKGGESLEGEENRTNSSPSADESAEETSTPISPPEDPKEPVISDVTYKNKEVTLQFVNFAAPDSPEGGFELMIDGERTHTEIVPRLYSSNKYLKMKFTLDKPEEHIYQIYARWNSGYISSEDYTISSNNNGSVEEEDETISDESQSFSGSVVPFSTLRIWNFNQAKPTNEGGLKFWGLNNGVISSESGASDGKAAKFFVKHGSNSYRMELVMTEDIPRVMSNYFSDSRGIAYAEMGNEVVYQYRIKLSDKWEKDRRYFNGDGYVSLFEFKQDYFSSREPFNRIRDATFRLRISKDTYNFVFRATNEPLSKARRNSAGDVVQNGEAIIETLSASSDFNKWRTWTVHANWSAGNDGFIKIYRDNDLVYRRENTYTCYDDESWLGPYMKFGLHESWFKAGNDVGSDYKEVYFDYVKVGVPK